MVLKGYTFSKKSSHSSNFQARELDAMDEVFGIGDLIDEDIKTEKSKVYSAKHIKGLYK